MSIQKKKNQEKYQQALAEEEILVVKASCQ